MDRTIRGRGLMLDGRRAEFRNMSLRELVDGLPKGHIARVEYETMRGDYVESLTHLAAALDPTTSEKDKHVIVTFLTGAVHRMEALTAAIRKHTKPKIIPGA